MRDIRSDLVDRLDMAKARARELARKYEQDLEALGQEYRRGTMDVDQECDVLRALIAIEDKREGLPPTTHPPTVRMALPEFIVATIRAHGPASKDELRTYLDGAGYFDGETTGRTLHTTLLNITKSGKLRQDLAGTYWLPLPPNQKEAPLPLPVPH